MNLFGGSKTIGHLQVPKTLSLKTTLGQVQNLSCENEYYLHNNNKKSFSQQRFALGLVLKQRLEASRKWPIATSSSEITKQL